MGYVCPVCSVAATDAVEIANHLAVTASLGRDDHLEWLETHASEWGQQRPAELAETVQEFAQPIEEPETTGVEGGPQLEAELAAQSQRRGRGAMAVGGSDPGSGPDPDAEAVLEEARALSQQMAADDQAAPDRSPCAEPGPDTDPEENG